MTSYCQYCGKGPFPTEDRLNKHIGHSKDCLEKTCLAFNSYMSNLWKKQTWCQQRPPTITVTSAWRSTWRSRAWPPYCWTEYPSQSRSHDWNVTGRLSNSTKWTPQPTTTKPSSGRTLFRGISKWTKGGGSLGQRSAIVQANTKGATREWYL